MLTDLSFLLLEVFLGIIGSGLLLFGSFLIFVYYQKHRISIVPLFISIAEFMIWMFMTSLFILQLMNSRVSIPTLTFFHGISVFFSSLGLLIWFLIFQLLGTSHQRISNMAVLALSSLILGLTNGYLLVSTTFEWTGTHWIIKHDLLGNVLFLWTYGMFVGYQLFIYVTKISKISHFKFMDELDISMDMLGKIIIYCYYLSMFLTLITFIGTEFELDIPFTSWMFFAGLSQLVLSITIVFFPKAILFGHLHFYEMGVYSTKDGLTVFHVRPDPNPDASLDKEDFLTVALKGMEQVVARLIGAKEPITTLGFGDRHIILFPAGNYYFYAIVNEPDFIARDATRRLAKQWNTIAQATSIDHEKLSSLTNNPKIKEFIQYLRDIAREYLR